jgi:hypothetical protein
LICDGGPMVQQMPLHMTTIAKRRSRAGIIITGTPSRGVGPADPRVSSWADPHHEAESTCTTRAERPDRACNPHSSHLRGYRGRVTPVVRRENRVSEGPAPPAVRHETSRSVSRPHVRANWRDSAQPRSLGLDHAQVSTSQMNTAPPPERGPPLSCWPIQTRAGAGGMRAQPTRLGWFAARRSRHECKLG